MASHHTNHNLMSLTSMVNHSKHHEKKAEKSKKRSGFFSHILPQLNESEGSIQQLHAIQMIV
jgi:hypothetical protein